MRTSARLVALFVVIVVFGFVAFGGLFIMNRSITDTHTIVSTLQYNAVRGDCIRGVQADVEQQFHRDIADLLSAGRNPALYGPLVKRMQAEAKVNYADTVLKDCPPAIKAP